MTNDGAAHKLFCAFVVLEALGFSHSSFLPAALISFRPPHFFPVVGSSIPLPPVFPGRLSPAARLLRICPAAFPAANHPPPSPRRRLPVFGALLQTAGCPWPHQQPWLILTWPKK